VSVVKKVNLKKREKGKREKKGKVRGRQVRLIYLLALECGRNVQTLIGEKHTSGPRTGIGFSAKEKGRKKKERDQDASKTGKKSVLENLRWFPVVLLLFLHTASAGSCCLGCA